MANTMKKFIEKGKQSLHEPNLRTLMVQQEKQSMHRFTKMEKTKQDKQTTFSYNVVQQHLIIEKLNSYLLHWTVSGLKTTEYSKEYLFPYSCFRNLDWSQSLLKQEGIIQICVYVVMLSLRG